MTNLPAILDRLRLPVIAAPLFIISSPRTLVERLAVDHSAHPLPV